MTKYAISRAKQMKNNQPIRKRKKISPVLFCVIFLCIGLVVSGVSYLNLLNEKATYGYKVSILENKLDSLKKFNQKLKLIKIDLEQTSRLEEIALNLKMVKSEQVDFLTLVNDSVAVR